ncbi:hypothetical protein ACE04B_38265, partial [Rhizobium phaseoli]
MVLTTRIIIFVAMQKASFPHYHETMPLQAQENYLTLNCRPAGKQHAIPLTLAAYRCLVFSGPARRRREQPV